MNIGFIGLGLMGRPMAMHLAGGGHQLHLWARRADTLVPFKDQGAILHSSAAALAAQVDRVFTMVADAPDVAEVILGENGVARGGKPGLIVVDMSTIAPPAARKIGAQLATQGIEFLDAPVSGGETGAINASLTIMVGGKAEIFARVQPLFDLMGQSVTYIGDCGAGQIAKACNQILTGVQVAAVAEALNFARQSGVDPERVRQALLGGFAYSRTLENHGKRMLEGNFRPGFKAWMHQKDLHIVLAEAQRLGLPAPTVAAAAQMFNTLVGAGMGEEDSVALYKLFGMLANWGSEKKAVE